MASKLVYAHTHDIYISTTWPILAAHAYRHPDEISAYVSGCTGHSPSCHGGHDAVTDMHHDINVHKLGHAG